MFVWSYWWKIIPNRDLTFRAMPYSFSFHYLFCVLNLIHAKSHVIRGGGEDLYVLRLPHKVTDREKNKQRQSSISFPWSRAAVLCSAFHREEKYTGRMETGSETIMNCQEVSLIYTSSFFCFIEYSCVRATF